VVYRALVLSLEWLMDIELTGRNGRVVEENPDEVDAKQLTEFLMGGFKEFKRRETPAERFGRRVIDRLGKVVEMAGSGEVLLDKLNNQPLEGMWRRNLL
jgi:hypothetical protein